MIVLGAGHYRLRERMATSAYGVLWRADGPATIGPVALKLINCEQMAGAPAQQRERWIASAQTEINFLRSLAPWDQRHIVRLLDSGEQAGRPALALELLDQDLKRYVAAEHTAGRTIPFTRTLGWIAQINQALAKVHQYGWRYLDLKPGNLLFDSRTGSVKLADFGTNRALADLHPHSYAGTPNWQAPEQVFAQGAEGYLTDARTDYFALGALLYYLVTNGQPLRFCSSCAQAWREHGQAAGKLLPMPAVLDADEEVRFAQAISIGHDLEAASRALALLRALVAARRENRPRHAIEISRMIAHIRDALHAGLRRAA
ncbi:protein kinase domain-containing protein [Massilia horti]|nr:protein kinase [Massilia horti]